MRYDFLVETYETERIKVVCVWSEFRDEDLTCGRSREIHEGAACTNRWCTSA